MARGSCSICSSPNDVAQAIDAALTKKEPLRLLAARSGFSRAALSRHSRRCRVRMTIENHRLASGPAATPDTPVKFFTLWPNKAIPRGLPSDVPVFRVEYDPPWISNPRNLAQVWAAALREDTERQLAAASVRDAS